MSLSPAHFAITQNDVDYSFYDDLYLSVCGKVIAYTEQDLGDFITGSGRADQYDGGQVTTTEDYYYDTMGGPESYPTTTTEPIGDFVSDWGWQDWLAFSRYILSQ